MADSFSSLLSLVDNHLSKTNVQASRSAEAGCLSFDLQIPQLNASQSVSETHFTLSPGQRLPIPTLNVNKSQISNILAEQVSNMLKAKERQQKDEEEKRQLEDKMKKVKLSEAEDNCVIDLMVALKTPYNPGPLVKQSETCSSSLESLFEPKFIDSDDENLEVTPKILEPALPCMSDISYILSQKIPRAKCSAFGKVLSSRYRPVAAPYLTEKVISTVKRFQFNTKSPCDINEAKRKQRTYSSSNNSKE